MVDELSLIKGEGLDIGPYIHLNHPTLDEIRSYGEQKYWTMIYMLCASSSDYMVELDEAGIDYNDLTDFQFFIYIAKNLKQSDTQIILGDLDLQKLELGTNIKNNAMVYFYDNEDGTQTVIDEVFYTRIIEYIRKIHYIEKKKIIAANEHTKQYLIEKEKRRRKRRHSNKIESILAPSISALVNSEGFKYDYQSIWNLPIFCFFDALRRIHKIKNYTNIMNGICSGTISSKNMNMEELNWSSKI